MWTDPIANALGDTAAAPGAGAVLLRILLAAVLAAVIGFERSSKRHAAGLRTFLLVSLAGSVAMILDEALLTRTERGFYMLSAAAIIGAAVISVNSILFNSKNQIKGLTTSAALWGCAFIGIAAGAGAYTVTLASFVVLLISLSIMPSLENYLKDRSNHFEVHLELLSSRNLKDFVTTARELGLIIDDIELNPAYANAGISVYTVSLSISSAELKKYKTHREIIDALSTLEYVYHIEEMGS